MHTLLFSWGGGGEERQMTCVYTFVIQLGWGGGEERRGEERRDEWQHAHIVTLHADKGY